ncbi:MAG: quinolinate synthetase [Phycisphaerae bacterium SG8_4]|nr:MAG: quinolinate synthetase [Phycisphaerae bacterium SG8_4]
MAEQLIERIQDLKQERGAVILAHNYQCGEVQDLADFAGDSLGLSIKAAETDADVIVFCGVKFMAETAAILSPEKTVLLPEKSAGCPMADMINAEQLRGLKQDHPDALVVCYVNSTAEVKAESDYCCTSANAVEVVNSLPADKRVIFVPDRNLGQFVAERTGRDLVLWPGYCTTHVVITADDIVSARAQHPDAIVMAHPECTAPVRELADELLSTGQMLKFAAASAAKEFIVATEIGIIHALKKQNPQAEFFGATQRAVCPNMKKITLDKVIGSLEDMQHKIAVPDEIRTRAKKALDRMVEILPVQ